MESDLVQMSNYTEDVVLTVRPFTRQQDRDGVILGIRETGVFLVIAPEAADLLDELASGKSIGDVMSAYESRYNERPDLEDFLGLLEAKGVVARPGETASVLVGETAAQQTNRRYHFANFSERKAKLIFNPITVTGALALIAIALAAIAADASLTPKPEHLVFSNRLTLTWTILGLLNIAGVFAHEMAHLMAARAAGVASQIGIGNRLWYLVAETDLTGLWAIPKRERYLPLLSGILCDSSSAAVFVLLIAAHHRGLINLSAFVIGLAQAMTFSYCMAIVWQFFLFMRTDIYFVIATAFNCRNLLGDTEVFLRNRIARITSAVRYRDQSAIPAREMKMIRSYAGIWIAGRIWAVATLVWVAIPVGWSYLWILAGVAQAGYAANPSRFVDSAVLSFYFLAPVIAGFTLWIRGFSASRGK